MRVLLIDDNPAMLRLYTVWLRSHVPGSVVTVMHDAPENARDMINFDGVVLDEMLIGRQTGQHVAERIRAAAPDLPIMLLTGVPRQIIPLPSKTIDYAFHKDDYDIALETFTRYLGRIIKARDQVRD